MNIGIVTTWFPSGAGYVSLAYKQALENNNIFIYARGGKKMINDPLWDNENVYWAKDHFEITGIWIGEFKKWIIKNKIEVIIFNEQRYWEPILVAKEMGIKVAAYVDYYTQQTVPLFSIYDFLFCNTKRHYSVFSWHQGAHYIPWGIDINKFKPVQKDSNFLTFLVSVGVESERDRRGGRLAIDAFLEVKGNVKLLVCCQTPRELCSMSFINCINSDPRIEVRFGTFDKLPFDEADIFVYPSRLEGIGLALPEAVGSGLACITSNSAPMNEFVENSYNGFLINIDKYLGTHHGYYWAESICSISHLTELMQEYIDNKKLVEEHKANARLYALENLDWSINSKVLLDILKSDNEIYNSIYNDLKRNDFIKNNSFSYKVKKLVFYVRASIKNMIFK